MTGWNVTDARELSDLKLIGEGGYCVVLKATHSVWNTVAYKKLSVQSVKEHEKLKLMKEAAIHAVLEHPHIVKLLGLVFEPGNYGLILEYMEYGDLEEYLHSHEIDLEEKLRLIREVASGMKYLHSRTPPVIHGDLKFQNVLVSSQKTAKVSDFGFSDWKQFSQSKSKNNVRFGTVSHVPPENWTNPHLRKTESYDVYGFGILIFEAMTLEQPFKGDAAMIREWVLNECRPNISALPVDVSEKIKQLMQLCWHHNPNKRPTFEAIESNLIGGTMDAVVESSGAKCELEAMKKETSQDHVCAKQGAKCELEAMKKETSQDHVCAKQEPTVVYRTVYVRDDGQFDDQYDENDLRDEMYDDYDNHDDQYDNDPDPFDLYHQDDQDDQYDPDDVYDVDDY